MAMATMKCKRPGCNKTVEEADRAFAIELMEFHDVQAHSVSNAAEQPRRSELAMSSHPVERLSSKVIATPGPDAVTASSVEDTAAVTSTKHPRNTSSVKISMANDAPVQDSNPSWQRGVEGITTRETFPATSQAQKPYWPDLAATLPRDNIQNMQGKAKRNDTREDCSAMMEQATNTQATLLKIGRLLNLYQSSPTPPPLPCPWSSCSYVVTGGGKGFGQTVGAEPDLAVKILEGHMDSTHSETDTDFPAFLLLKKLLLGLSKTPVTHTAPARQAKQQEGPLDDVKQQEKPVNMQPTNQPVKTTKVSLHCQLCEFVTIKLKPSKAKQRLQNHNNLQHSTLVHPTTKAVSLKPETVTAQPNDASKNNTAGSANHKEEKLTSVLAGNDNFQQEYQPHQQGETLKKQVTIPSPCQEASTKEPDAQHHAEVPPALHSPPRHSSLQTPTTPTVVLVPPLGVVSMPDQFSSAPCRGGVKVSPIVPGIMDKPSCLSHTIACTMALPSCLLPTMPGVPDQPSTSYSRGETPGMPGIVSSPSTPIKEGAVQAPAPPPLLSQEDSAHLPPQGQEDEKLTTCSLTGQKETQNQTCAPPPPCSDSFTSAGEDSSRPSSATREPSELSLAAVVSTKSTSAIGESTKSASAVGEPTKSSSAVAEPTKSSSAVGEPTQSSSVEAAPEFHQRKQKDHQPREWLQCDLCDYKTNAGKLIKAQARLLTHKKLHHEQPVNTEDTVATGSHMVHPRAPALLLQVVTQDSTAVFCTAREPVPNYEVELLMPELYPLNMVGASRTDTYSTDTGDKESLQVDIKQSPQPGRVPPSLSHSQQPDKMMSLQPGFGEQNLMTKPGKEQHQPAMTGNQQQSPRPGEQHKPAKPGHQQNQPVKASKQQKQPVKASKQQQQPVKASKQQQQSLQLGEPHQPVKPCDQQQQPVRVSKQQQYLQPGDQHRPAKPCKQLHRQVEESRQRQPLRPGGQRQPAKTTSQQRQSLTLPNRKHSCGVCSTVSGGMQELFHTCPAPSELVTVPDPGTEHAQATLPKPTFPIKVQAILLEGAREDMNNGIELLLQASQNLHLTEADLAVITRAVTEMRSADSHIQSQLQSIQQHD